MGHASKNRPLVEQAIQNGMALHVRMGEAADEDMNYRTWHGYVFPTGFSKSRQGERVDCLLEPAEEYFATNSRQMPGNRKLLLDEFEVIGLVNRRPSNDDGVLYLQITL